MDSRSAANDPLAAPAGSSDAIWQVRIARAVEREGKRAFRYGLFVGIAIGVLPGLVKIAFHLVNS
ncbi:hypothetical protein [Pseudomonas sp. PDM13]|uniref:hypothetical protein n=1 Tax=Pseudomonas sp. PDM13 TaxID=2769255 RepID=UPI0021E0C797|nr:hypothetical protein [Pseudomonas sp. PDM13]MCU9948265.1 hypothetical protein [Pseudomonas sp. PDM13]MCU9948280.1 hypothetical protein [Pseudomonas sp. PDM13]